MRTSRQLQTTHHSLNTLFTHPTMSSELGIAAADVATMSVHPSTDVTDDVMKGLDDDVSTITLVVGPNKDKFVVPRKWLEISGVAKKAMGDPNATEIPVTNENVKSVAIPYLIKYLEHHKGTPANKPEFPAKPGSMKNNCTDPWDAEFADSLWGETKDEKQVLYNVLLAANFLDINCLTHILCCKLAIVVRGVPVEKIKQTLGLEEDDPTLPSAPVAAAAAASDSAQATESKTNDDDEDDDENNDHEDDEDMES